MVRRDSTFPLERCSVCKHEPHATSCTCSILQLLDRGDIDEIEAYRLTGIEVPPGGFTVPDGARAAPRQSLSIRLLNAWGAFKYTWRHGRSCSHSALNEWCVIDSSTRQIRWCRTCGHAEFRG